MSSMEVLPTPDEYFAHIEASSGTHNPEDPQGNYIVEGHEIIIGYRRGEDTEVAVVQMSIEEDEGPHIDVWDVDHEAIVNGRQTYSFAIERQIETGVLRSSTSLMMYQMMSSNPDNPLGLPEGTPKHSYMPISGEDHRIIGGFSELSDQERTVFDLAMACTPEHIQIAPSVPALAANPSLPANRAARDLFNNAQLRRLSEEGVVLPSNVEPFAFPKPLVLYGEDRQVIIQPLASVARALQIPLANALDNFTDSMLSDEHRPEQIASNSLVALVDHSKSPYLGILGLSKYGFAIEGGAAFKETDGEIQMKEVTIAGPATEGFVSMIDQAISDLHLLRTEDMPK